jgi:hypothetical protein
MAVQEASMTTPRRFTRRELYDLVWSKPIATLAGELGISGVGLAKICVRHRIPTPPREYWAKLQAGKKVNQTPFAETDDPKAALIEVFGNLAQLPEATRTILEIAKAKRMASKAEKNPTAILPSVAGPEAELHQSIRPTAKILRNAKPDRNGAVQAVGDGLCGIEVSSINIDRVVTLLDRLAKQLDKKSIPLTPCGRCMRVSIGSDSADFTITEQRKRETHVPTQEDLAAEERRQKKLQRYWNAPRSWDSNSENIFDRAYPEFDVIYTGELVFQIEGYGEGVRRKWADGKTQSLESLLDDIVVGIDVVLSVRKTDREAREERERQRNHLAQRRELARQRSKREDDRTAYLNSILELHTEIDGLKDWLSRLEFKQAPATSNADFLRLVDWARSRVGRLEATLSPTHIDQDLREKRLFPETDDLHDPAGEPPVQAQYW